MSKSRVALLRGDDRYRNVRQALDAIEDDIDLAGKERITIKPNFVTVYHALAATHPDAVRAVLDFLKQRGVQQVTLIGGPAVGSFQQGLENYGYMPLVEKYGLHIVELNNDDSVEVDIYDEKLRPIQISVARTAVESDYRISVCPTKTHDLAIVTLSLKNLAVGSITKGQKSRSHQGHRGINLNLYRLAHHVAPHLSVLDGFVGMEGKGPAHGDPVDWRVAIASTDFVAADSFAAQMMGFELENVGYLSYCARRGMGQGRIEDMEIVGNVALEAVRRRFEPHPTYQEQLGWRIPDVERYL